MNHFIQHIWRSYYPAIVLFLFSLLNIVLLSPIFQEGLINGHDNTSHYIYSLRLAEMVQEGNFRLWLPDFSMGMPLFYYYQPIPHCATAAIFLLFPMVEPLLLMKIIVVALLTLLPLSIYQGFRWMGLPRSICLLTSLLTFSIQSWQGLGFELRAVLGWGLYAQLWGMVLTPLAIAYVYKSYWGNRSLWLPTCLIGILLLTHILSGIIACLSIGLLIFMHQLDKKESIKGLFYITKIYIGAFAIAALLLIPTLLGGAYISGYFKLDETHHLGLGLQKAIHFFFNGKLFDGKRLPVFTITLIMSIGLGIFLSDKKQWFNNIGLQAKAAGFIILNFIMAFLLLAGAKTFTFLQYTPLYDNVPFLRLLSHLHFFSLPIIGFGLIILGKFILQASISIKNWRDALLRIACFIGLTFIACYFLHSQVKQFGQYAKANVMSNPKAVEEVSDFLGQLEGDRVNVAKVPGAAYYLPALQNKAIGRFYAAGNRSNLGQYYLHKFNNQSPLHYELFGFPYLMAANYKEYKYLTNVIFNNERFRIYKTTSQQQYFDIVRTNTVTLSQNQAARQLLTYWMKNKDFLLQKNHIAIADQHPKRFFQENGFSNFIELQRKDKRLAASQFTLANEANAEHLKTIIDLKDDGLANYLNHQIDSIPENGWGNIIKESIEDGYYKAEIEVFPQENDAQALWAMLKVNAHMDWQAKVDGQRVDWVQMSPCFMAVPITPGTHIVEFEFGVSPLRWALCGLSLLTIIGLGCYEVFSRREPKRKLVFSQP